jgi:hypothetical protein
MVACLLGSGNIFISTWNSASSNYNVFTQSVLTSFTTAISWNGDRLIYSNTANDNWYLAFWNGSDYVGNTLVYTKSGDRHAFFSGDSSILFVTNFATNGFAYGTFNQTTKKYENFQTPSTSTVIPDGNLYGCCYVDGITSGALYVVTYGTTTMYLVTVNYTIQPSSTQTRYVSLPSFTTTNNGLTFACWFKSNYNVEWSRIFDFGNGVNSDNIVAAVGAFSNGLNFATVYNGVFSLCNTTGYVLNNNNWNHLVITLSYANPGSQTSNFIVYLNGVSVLNVNNMYYPLNVTRTKNYIGRANNTYDSEFFGNVDDFRVYNTVLSASQVQSVYNNTSLIPVADNSSYNFEKALSLEWNGQLFVLTVRKDTYMGSTNNKDYLYSYDGSTWITGSDISNSTLLVNKNPYNVKWLGNQYEIMGNITSTTSGNTLLKSRDGTSFSSIPANNSVPVYDLDANLEFNNTITFPKDVTLALGGASADSTKIAYSLNGGISWTPSANSSTIFSNTVYNAAWNGKLWVAVGSGGNTIATSTDGSNWIGRGSYIFNTAGYGIAWSNEQTMWVAGGEGTNSLAYSYDGVYWSGLGNTIVNPVYDVEWNGSLWVAAGAPISGNKSIAYSYDGLNWQLPAQTNLFDVSAQRISWNGSFWTGIGKSTANNGFYNMATSMDGIRWNMINNTSFNNEILTSMYANPKIPTTFITSYVPIAPPTNLSVTGKTNTTISISYTAPITMIPVTTYTVVAAPASGTTITQTFSAPATTYTITGLQSGVQYTISMTSTNTFGTSNSSSSITSTTNFTSITSAVTPSVLSGYNIYTFTSNSTITIETNVTKTIYYLVVGGGGAGGGDCGGGGGGGGVLQGSCTINSNDTITVTVGEGGTSFYYPTPSTNSTYPTTANGKNSSIIFTSNTSNNKTSIGGGYGGWTYVVSAYGNGATSSTGGSGGGGGQPNGAGSAGTTGQGNAGATGISAAGKGLGGGGGGANANANNKDGGIGIQCVQLGISSLYPTYYWGGGGGGGGHNYANGGNGGNGGGGGGALSGSFTAVGTGGSSALNSGSNGTRSIGGNGGANTGGGGGGGPQFYQGGSGGSGIVIIAIIP